MNRIRPGLFRFDPVTHELLTTDEEIFGRRAPSTPPLPASPRANNGPGIWGPYRVEGDRGAIFVLGRGKSFPVDSRAEGEALIRELEAAQLTPPALAGALGPSAPEDLALAPLALREADLSQGRLEGLEEAASTGLRDRRSGLAGAALLPLKVRP